MKRLLITWLLCSALVTGCKGTLPGDRCDAPEDCDPPLVCSNVNEPAGTRGICVSPEAVPDAAVTTDASP